MQLQKMARGWKFQISKVEELHCPCENMALISLTDTAKLICAFVFAYAKCLFSHDVAHIALMILSVEHRTESLEPGVHTRQGQCCRFVSLSKTH